MKIKRFLFVFLSSLFVFIVVIFAMDLSLDIAFAGATFITAFYFYASSISVIIAVRAVTLRGDIEKNHEPFQKTFIGNYPATQALIFYAICFVISLFFAWFDARYIGFSLVQSLLLIIVVLGTRVRKLILSDKGIEYRTVLGKYSKKWSDVFLIVGLTDETDVIVFKDDSTQRNLLSFILDNRIPISPFDEGWRHNEIGKIIKEQISDLLFI